MSCFFASPYSACGAHGSGNSGQAGEPSLEVGTRAGLDPLDAATSPYAKHLPMGWEIGIRANERMNHPERDQDSDCDAPRPGSKSTTVRWPPGNRATR